MPPASGLRASLALPAIAMALAPAVQPAFADGGLASWEWLGPGNIGGRVRAILPLDATTILAGGIGGGIWRTTDAGASWAAVNDTLPSLAVTCLARDPSLPDHIYAGTGEGFLTVNVRIDGSKGAGVLRSVDGGLTWSPFGGSQTWVSDPDDRFVSRVALDGAGNVLAATNGGIHRSTGGPFAQVFEGWVTDVKFTRPSGSAFGDGAVAGLMTYCADVRCETTEPEQEIVCAVYSSDGGVTWAPSQFLGAPTNALSQAYTVGDTCLVLDSARPYQRFDIIRVGDSPGQLVQVGTRYEDDVTLPLLHPTVLDSSYDEGTSVRLIPSQRTELAVYAGSPNIVYASMGAGGGTVWKSTDGGATFSFVSNPDYDYLHGGVNLDGANGSTRAFYTSLLWVAPDDSGLVVVGGGESFRSTDGGGTFTKITSGSAVLNGTSPHLDHHVLAEVPGSGPEWTVYIGDDGGVHRAPGVRTVTQTGWDNLNWNLGVTQFYGGAATMSDSVQWFVGGGQDNGRPHLRFDGVGAPDPNAWAAPYNVAGDDLYAVAIDASDPENPVFYAAQSCLGRVFKSVGGSIWTIENTPDQGTVAQIYAPFLLDPHDPETLLAGSQSVFRSTDGSVTWTNIRPQFVAPAPPRAGLRASPDVAVRRGVRSGHRARPAGRVLGRLPARTRLVVGRQRWDVDGRGIRRASGPHGHRHRRQSFESRGGLRDVRAVGSARATRHGVVHVQRRSVLGAPRRNAAV